MPDASAPSREVLVSLPDDVARALGGDAELPGRVLEAVVVELVREGRMSLSAGALALGVPYYDFLLLLGRHEVSIFEMTDEEFEHQRKVLDEMDRKRGGQAV